MPNKGVYDFRNMKPKNLEHIPVQLVDTGHKAQMKVLPNLNKETSFLGRVIEWFKKVKI